MSCLQCRIEQHGPFVHSSFKAFYLKLILFSEHFVYYLFKLFFPDVNKDLNILLIDTSRRYLSLTVT